MRPDSNRPGSFGRKELVMAKNRWFASLGSRSRHEELEPDDYGCEQEDPGEDSASGEENAETDELDQPEPCKELADGAKAGGLVTEQGTEGESRSLQVPEDQGLVWEPSAEDMIYSAFDASQPANQPVDLRGRDNELRTLLGAVLYRRNHAFIAGLRGSGKTSLLRVFGHLADRDGVVVVNTSCAKDTQFGALFRELLEQIPYSCVDPDKADLFESRVEAFGRDGTPLQAVTIAAMVEYSQVVMVIDEFDRVQCEEARADIAATLKLISDRRLPVRMVLAGDEASFVDIIDSHPSLLRHVTQVLTKPLEESAILSLFDICSSRSGISFSDEAKDLLVRTAMGSPYHARLFGMNAAIVAAGRGSKVVSEKDAYTGLAHSYQEWASINPDDATVFRRIVDGWHGNPARFVELSKALVSPKGSMSDALENAVPELRDREVTEELDAFGGALVHTKEGAVFRDGTAPQFLVALQAIGREHTRRKYASEEADV
ncbi:AAA family ATPase [Altererythrobacter sp. Z27]|uniref:AAA family ATPase n=1 Tax=Altererythrobacter sp. Z27 TaxID=3461147 RepID=UPI0040445059